MVELYTVHVFKSIYGVRGRKLQVRAMADNSY